MKRFISTFLFLVLFLSFAELMAQPSPPILVSPTNGATNVSLFPTFDWSDVSGATSYRLQVFQGANTVLDVSNITQSQYSVVTAVLQGNTSYYWRVNATGGSGTSNWSAQWTFTTVVAAPPIPVLSAPANGSTGVALTPVLTWNSSPGATQYRVQVSTVSNFTSTVVDVSGLANTGYVIQSGVLSNGVQYFWRVNASNSGGTSDWSTAWNFTTIVAPPPAPTLLSPPNTASNVTVTPTLDWSDVSGASGYKVQVALNSSFTALVYDETVTVSQTTLPSGTLSGQTTYYWRVAAINAGGQGNFTTPWSFTTIVAPPAAPFLSAPPNNATGVSRTVTLDWNSVPTATSYRVQVSTNPGFTSTVVNMVTGSTSSYTVPNGVLNYNTQYYWRVNATNAGGTGLWSAVWNFTTTIQAPSAPTLIAPTNGSTGQPLTPQLNWSDVSGANSYRVQISTSNSFNTTVLDVNNVAQSEFNVPSGILTGNTLYYWRVAGINTGGQGSYSSTWSFTTLNTFYLNLKVYLEGFWDGAKQVKDTVKVYLANPTTPFTLRDSSAAFLDSTGSALISLGKAPNGNYYVIVKHRNHLETWSSTAPSFATGSTSNYDFTTAATKAYGSNMKQVGSVWVLYGGDGNADGFVNPDDYIFYRQQFGRDGYKGSDYNGDGFVDGYDLPIIYSNFGKSYSRPF